MGFRSTLISEHQDVTWPRWFREKHLWCVPDDASEVLRTGSELKAGARSDFPEDVRRALAEQGWFEDHDDGFVFVWLHECGGVTRVQVNEDKVRITYPLGWGSWDGGSQDSIHHYCYGCSDARKVEAHPEPGRRWLRARASRSGRRRGWRRGRRG